MTLYPDDEIARELLIQERVDGLIARITALPHEATGWTEFDVAWLEMRRARPSVPADRCPTRRQLVRRFADRLDQLLPSLP